MYSLPTYTGTAVVLIGFTVVFRYLRRSFNKQPEVGLALQQSKMSQGSSSKLIQSLTDKLPTSIILPSDTSKFQQAIDGNWAQQNREIIPACIIQPCDAQELSKAVVILKKEYNARKAQGQGEEDLGRFAVRSGGVNPGLSVATMQDGIVIDLSLICEVSPSADGSSVTLGTGAKWIDVYKKLDEKGLVVMGGRNAPVGVGGLTLQGGISFYSPRYGFVCSNAISYEVVLADGSIVTASASEHPDLWRVLKGGCNNFGIVTRFTLRAMPSAPLWVGQIFTLAAFQHAKARTAFHSYVADASSGRPGAFDENAAGPILSFAYAQPIGLQIMALHMVYTKVGPEVKQGGWPAHWKASKFTSLWPLYRTYKVQSHTDAVTRLGATAPAGTRHVQGTTTIRNDLETINVAYDIFCRTTNTLSHVKGLLFPFIYQAILPEWMNKGHPNVLGLEACKEPLVILSCSVTWREAKDDELVRSTVRGMFEEIDSMARAREMDHPYRFMNYCMEWQRPFDGCSEEDRERMRQASKRYDPDGLFQRGCVGGFKLESQT